MSHLFGGLMRFDDERELLEQAQLEATQIADEMEGVSGLDRRRFIFMSLIATAATTFGVGAEAVARAQGAAGAAAPTGGRGQGAQNPPPPPLGNGENVSWTFQPYPGGTGALMEKLMK